MRLLVVDPDLSREAVGRAVGAGYVLGGGVGHSTGRPAVVEFHEPSVLVAGPSVVPDATRISALTGGSLVLLGERECEALQARDPRRAAEAADVLRIAALLASVSPPVTS